MTSGSATLTLHFTKASGGGENLAFTEGEVPLVVERRNERQWIGRASLALEQARARRRRHPGVSRHRARYQSERLAGAIGAIPDRDWQDRADRGRGVLVADRREEIRDQPADGDLQDRGAAEDEVRRLEQTLECIAIEQRMVRAEVVFLGGGEVEDEVEEAAHSHELAEGRMQNTGRVEMMRALNAMSRAEALLNDGRPREALVFEREALASLERALDRRRYFLRTLPDRSRIDVTRRLTGTRTEARSWLRDQSSPAGSTSISAHRRVMRELVSAAAARRASTRRSRLASPPSIRPRSSFSRRRSRSPRHATRTSDRKRSPRRCGRSPPTR